MDTYAPPIYRPRQTATDSIFGAIKLVTFMGSALLAAFLIASSVPGLNSLNPPKDILSLDQSTVISVPLKYTTFPDVGKVATPHLEATIIGKSKNIPVTFLLDSGAKISALPMRYADEVGLNKETAKRIYLRSATDNTTYGYISDIDIRLGDTTMNIPITFAEVIEPLLGTFGFFDKYTIIFENGEQVIIKTKG